MAVGSPDRKMAPRSEKTVCGQADRNVAPHSEKTVFVPTSHDNVKFCNVTKREKELISKRNIIKLIPKECLKKDTLRSMAWCGLDFACWGLMLAIFRHIYTTYSDSLPLWFYPYYIIHCYLTGLFMFGLFMVGHDCGHCVFSETYWINPFFGHIVQGACLIPHYPWTRAHNMHHNHHNHVHKDMHFPWTAEGDDVDNNLRPLRKLLPNIGFIMYMTLGLPGGSFYNCFQNNTLYGTAPLKEKLKGTFSAFTCLVWLYYFHQTYGGWNNLAIYYGGPWLCCMFYSFTLPFFNHHHEKAIVYDDSTWNFEVAAFQTVDRKYGWLVDTFAHHVTDGHLMHHLFFTKIPHYNLPKATQALEKYLLENNLSHLHIKIDTRDFLWGIYHHLSTYGTNYFKLYSENKTK